MAQGISDLADKIFRSGFFQDDETHERIARIENNIDPNGERAWRKFYTGDDQ